MTKFMLEKVAEKNLLRFAHCTHLMLVAVFLWIYFLVHFRWCVLCEHFVFRFFFFFFCSCTTNLFCMHFTLSSLSLAFCRRSDGVPRVEVECSECTLHTPAIWSPLSYKCVPSVLMCFWLVSVLRFFVFSLLYSAVPPQERLCLYYFLRSKFLFIFAKACCWLLSVFFFFLSCDSNKYLFSCLVWLAAAMKLTLPLCSFYAFVVFDLKALTGVECNIFSYFLLFVCNSAAKRQTNGRNKFDFGPIWPPWNSKMLWKSQIVGCWSLLFASSRLTTRAHTHTHFLFIYLFWIFFGILLLCRRWRRRWCEWW